MKICGISGSLRKASYNTALLEAVKELAEPDHSVEIASIDAIPLYNGDVEAQGMPEAVKIFGQTIHAADAILIVTPEYNAGIPGVLKNALDWASRIRPKVLDNKPAAMMGASPGRLGTVRAQMQLRNQLANLNMRVVAQPMVQVGHAGTFFDGAGAGLDEPTCEIIKRQLSALHALTR